MQLIPAIVFAYVKSWFSHDADQFMVYNSSVGKKKTILYNTAIFTFLSVDSLQKHLCDDAVITIN